MYGDLVSDDPVLTLPHPRAAERAFVLVPLHDADPEAVLPGASGSVAPLLSRLPADEIAGVRLRDDLSLVIDIRGIVWSSDSDPPTAPPSCSCRPAGAIGFATVGLWESLFRPDTPGAADGVRDTLPAGDRDLHLGAAHPSAIAARNQARSQ